jgi:N-acetylmuramic acid 6-phosphate etherase
MNMTTTESIDPSFRELDLMSNEHILQVLLDSQQRAVDAVRQASPQLEAAVVGAAERLASGDGRLILAGAGASGRLAVQDGAEMWPTYGWPHERLLLCMAGGTDGLLASIEGVEDDSDAAIAEVMNASVGAADVVVALAASGQSAWTCGWLEASRRQGALTIGMANNADTRLLRAAECPVWLDSGAEVLAGSTRMAAGTAQKIALNLFSTTLMIRLNRTHGNLMVDMAAVNSKLDQRRVRLLQAVLPGLDDAQARAAIVAANGWVKLAALIAMGDSDTRAVQRLAAHQGSLRSSLKELQSE